jgi:hypothetical protein
MPITPVSQILLQQLQKGAYQTEPIQLEQRVAYETPTGPTMRAPTAGERAYTETPEYQAAQQRAEQQAFETVVVRQFDPIAQEMKRQSPAGAGTVMTLAALGPLLPDLAVFLGAQKLITTISPKAAELGGKAITTLTDPMVNNLVRLGVPKVIAEPLADIVITASIGKAPAGQRSIPELITALKGVSKEDMATAVGAIRKGILAPEEAAQAMGREANLERALQRVAEFRSQQVEFMDRYAKGAGDFWQREADALNPKIAAAQAEVERLRAGITAAPKAAMGREGAVPPLKIRAIPEAEAPLSPKEARILAAEVPLEKPSAALSERPSPSVTSEQREKILNIYAKARVLRQEEIQPRITAARRQEAAVAAAARERETYTAMDWYKVSRGAQKGEIEVPRLEIPEGHFTPEDIQAYLDAARFYPWEHGQELTATNAAEAVLKMTSGQKMFPGDLKLIRRVFGPEVAAKVAGRQTGLLGKVGAAAVDLLFYFPRGLQAAYDASAVLRQSILVAARHPKETFGNIPRAYLASIFRESTAQNVLRESRRVPESLTNVAAIEALESRVFIPEWGAATLGAGEEMFLSHLAIEGVKIGPVTVRLPGLKESARGYAVYLGKVRADLYKMGALNLQSRSAADAEYELLARHFNIFTGRGEVAPGTWIEKNLNTLGFPFWAPRLYLSRVQAPIELFSRSPYVRRLAAEELAAFLGVGGAVLATVKYSGLADVEINPLSGDFGRMRIGATRLDFWGGYQPIMRQIAQFALGKRKAGAGYTQSISREETIIRTIRGKLNPGAGLLTDLMTGTTFFGEEMTLAPGGIKAQTFNRLAPLFVQDLTDAIRHQGLTGLAFAPAGFFGATLLTYQTPYDRMTLLEDDLLQRLGRTRKEMEQNPGIRALIRQTPEWIALRKELDEDAKRHGTPLEYRVSAWSREVHDTMGLLQSEDDARLQRWWVGEGESINPGEWDARTTDRNAVTFNRIDAVAAALDIQYEEDKAVPDSVLKAVQDYWKVDIVQYTDAATGYVEWDAFKGAQEAALAPLSTEDRMWAEKAIHAHDSPLMVEERQDEKRMQDYLGLSSKLWAEVALGQPPFNDLVAQKMVELSDQYPEQHITRAEAIVQLTVSNPQVRKYVNDLPLVKLANRWDNPANEALLYKWGRIDKILSQKAAEIYHAWFGRWPDDYEQVPTQYKELDGVYRRP